MCAFVVVGVRVSIIGIMHDAAQPAPESVPKPLKASAIRSRGGPDAFEYWDRPVLPPGPCEVLVPLDRLSCSFS